MITRGWKAAKYRITQPSTNDTALRQHQSKTAGRESGLVVSARRVDFQPDAVHRRRGAGLKIFLYQ